MNDARIEVRIIVCGSRGWTDREMIREFMQVTAVHHKHDRVVIVHGDARGADRMAGEEAERVGLEVEAHPADWRRWGKRAGPFRNEHMLSLGCTRVVAFWDGYSRGTGHMVRIAREADQRVLCVREKARAS